MTITNIIVIVLLGAMLTGNAFGQIEKIKPRNDTIVSQTPKPKIHQKVSVGKMTARPNRGSFHHVGNYKATIVKGKKPRPFFDDMTMGTNIKRKQPRKKPSGKRHKN